ncbi:MAG: heme-binding protein [Rhodopila sp.]
MGAVLAVWQSPGDPSAMTTFVNNPNGINFNRGLDGIAIPASKAAIAKAITAAYLSSSAGNAFSTRTASQIIQDHFDPGTRNASSGPLYGVQFSQLPCSDLMHHYDQKNPTQQPGPSSSPLGLAADPGGFPLYKNGQLVGGVGVKAVGPYSLDLNIHVNDESVDETLALAGTIGLSAPANIVASTITVNGLLLRYTDVSTANFRANPSAAPPFSAIAGGLIDVTDFYQKANGLLTGSIYGTPPSGLMPDTSGLISTANPPYLLDNCANGTCQVRYPFIAGAPGTLSRAEVIEILRSAYAVELQTRAQIRNPPGAAAKVTISVVDSNGTILGIVTQPDAPNFGIDVSLQKARTAYFMSSPQAGAIIAANAVSASPDPEPGAYIAASQAFFREPVFSEGIAWSARAIGNISRDTYPDGINGSPNGPLGLPAIVTTPFAVGLQLDLVFDNLIGMGQSPNYCTSLAKAANGVQPVLADGLQIFPGGFPIYRGNELIGGIGVSGDGVDQDDMIAFLGLYNAGVVLGTGIANAPPGVRSNLLSAFGAAPRYVNCPYSPFLDGSGDNVCNDK